MQLQVWRAFIQPLKPVGFLPVGDRKPIKHHYYDKIYHSKQTAQQILNNREPPCTIVSFAKSQRAKPEMRDRFDQLLAALH
jgi:hypothetical protein